MLGDYNETLVGMSQPLVMLQGIFNYVSYTISKNWFSWCFDGDVTTKYSMKSDNTLPLLLPVDCAKEDETFLEALTRTQKEYGARDTLFEKQMKKLQCEIPISQIKMGPEIGSGSNARVYEGTIADWNEIE